MNELLNLAVRAHGGLERWNKVTAIKVVASITGAIWYLKGKGDVLKNIVMTVDTKAERLVTDFPGQDKRSIFEPDRIVMQKTDGTVVESRNNPGKSFEGQQRETPWDDVHVAYFCGELYGLISILRSSTPARDSARRKFHQSTRTARHGDV